MPDDLAQIATRRRFTYMVKQPLMPRDFERYGIGHFLDRGDEVTVLDLSDVIHPDLPNDRSAIARDPRMMYRVLTGRDDLAAERHTIAASDLVMLFIQGFGLSRAVYRPLRMIAQAKVPYMIQCAPIYPGWQEAAANGTRGPADLWSWLLRRAPIDSVLSRVPTGFLGLPAASFAIQTGGGPQRRNNLIGPATRTIATHVYDYDIFLRERAKAPAPRDRAVFIDQYFPFHHDHGERGGISIDATSYYRRLNGLFDAVERTLGLAVVIAAHPRARYAPADPLFQGREIVRGETARLVLESKLVIAHASVATAYAVMAEKPILLVTTRDLARSVPGHENFCRSLARELNRELMFIDDGVTLDKDRAMAVDAAAYRRFLATYAVHEGAADTPSWQMIEREICGERV
jgi:hypothetical protein